MKLARNGKIETVSTTVGGEAIYGNCSMARDRVVFRRRLFAGVSRFIYTRRTRKCSARISSLSPRQPPLSDAITEYNHTDGSPAPSVLYTRVYDFLLPEIRRYHPLAEYIRLECHEMPATFSGQLRTRARPSCVRLFFPTVANVNDVVTPFTRII